MPRRRKIDFAEVTARSQRAFQIIDPSRCACRSLVCAEASGHPEYECPEPPEAEVWQLGRSERICRRCHESERLTRPSNYDWEKLKWQG